MTRTTRMGRPPVMSGDERKALIFSAAETLFGARGYEKVTMAEVATAAGMSKRTLYLLFPDKSELLRDLIASSYIWPTDAFDSDALDVIDALRVRLRVMADHVLSDRHISLCRLAISESTGTADISDAFLAMGIGASREHLIQSIASIPEDRIIIDLPPPIVAGMLYGATCGFRLMNALLTGDKPNRQEVYQTIDLIMEKMFI